MVLQPLAEKVEAARQHLRELEQQLGEASTEAPRPFAPPRGAHGLAQLCWARPPPSLDPPPENLKGFEAAPRTPEADGAAAVGPEGAQAACLTPEAGDNLLIAILEALNHPFVVINTDYTVAVANSAAGRTPSLGSATCFALAANRGQPCGQSKNPCLLETVKETREPTVVEHTHYRPDGTSTITEVHGYPILDDSGEVVQVIEYRLDITERKQLEATLSFERDKFNFILEKLPVGVSFLNSKDKYVYINPASLKIDGYKADRLDLLGQDVKSNHHPPVLAKVEALLSDFKSGKRSFSSREAKRGKRTVEISYHALRSSKGDYQGLLRLVADITERKSIEQALREQRRRILDIAGVIIVALDLQGRVTLINRKGCDLLGYSRAEIEGQDWFSTFVPDYAGIPTRNNIQQLIREGAEEVDYMESPVITSDRDERYIGWSTTLPRNDAGAVTGILQSGTDITAHKQEEEQMRRRLMTFRLDEGRLYLVLERSPRLALEAFEDLLEVGYRGVALTRTPPGEFGGTIEAEFQHWWMAETPAENMIAPDVKGLRQRIKVQSGRAAFLLDRLDYLIQKNSFAKTLDFIQWLREWAYLRGHVIILGLNPNTITKRELKLLEQETRPVEPRVKVRLAEGLVMIMRFVLDQNNLAKKPSYTEMGIEMKLSRPTARKRIHQLIYDDFLRESAKGRSKVLEVTEKGKRLLTP